MSKHKCVSCNYPIEIAGYLTNSGKPTTYIPTFYCDNNECYRYGLVSLYKAIQPVNEPTKQGGDKYAS